MKTVIIGRHQLLPKQKEALEQLKVTIAKQVPQVSVDPKELEEFIRQLKAEDVEALVVQALPVDLLSKLLPHFTIFFLKMKAIATVESEEEAKKLVAEAPDRRVIIPSALGEKRSFRVMEFVGITKIKRIVVEEEFVVKV